MIRKQPRQEVATPPTPPHSPTRLSRKSWLRVLRGAVREFGDDNLSDAAAALTYYSVQALFPGLLVLVSIVGFLSPNATRTLLDNLNPVVPGSVQGVLATAIRNLQGDQKTAGIAFILGLATAIWSASGYIAAFMRAANNVYDVPEGRPAWKTIPTRLGITIVLLVLMVVVAAIVVFTGPVAKQAGDLLGLGHQAVMAWDVVKWPVLVVILMVMVGVLFWAAPNARQPGFRWITPGGVLGVLLWLVASVAFAFYVANFSSYNKTYGTFAGVIIFLVWIWLSNLSLLLGAEFNAELDRARAEAGGLPVGAEPYVELRDDRKLDDDQRTAIQKVRDSWTRT